MDRILAAASALLLLGAACGPATEPVDLYVAALDLSSAPGLDNRFDYEVSGEDFDDPHVTVTDRVFVVEAERPEVDLDDGRRLIAGFDEPAPYLQGTPMALAASFGAAAGVDVARFDVSVQGTLRSTTDPDWPARALVQASASLDGAAPLEVVTDALPERVDVFELELAWTLAPADCKVGACAETELVTRHLVPTTWRAPREEAPRYRRAMLWSSAFAAGEWVAGADPKETELAIARAVLEGYATLDETAGKSYGGFPRPEYDGEVDGVDVWLDFPRSACGEQKFAVMAMIEYQGIDAKWGVLEFLDPGPDRLSQYVTYEVPALGRDPEVWYHTNHAFAVVHGHIFDGTYDRYAPTVAEYEDGLFAKFCYGKDDPCRYTSDWCSNPPEAGTYCIDNPPGHDPELGFTFYSGDSYR